MTRRGSAVPERVCPDRVDDAVFAQIDRRHSNGVDSAPVTPFLWSAST
jgi:hypothetical protein